MDNDGKRKRRDSVNRSLSTLKAALNLAFREARTPSDAEWKRVQAFKGVVGNRTGWLTIEEIRKLIAVCPDDFGRLVRAAILTGARYGELCRLTVGDFQPDSGTLFVAQSKSGKARHISLNSDGRAFFAEIARGRVATDTMLKRADATAWESHHQIRRMADACAKAGISPTISFHELRHTWASLSIMAGMPLQVAAQMLGHSDTRMVEKHYGHLSRTFVAQQVEEFAPRLGVA
jgi:integrase